MFFNKNKNKDISEDKITVDASTITTIPANMSTAIARRVRPRQRSVSAAVPSPRGLESMSITKRAAPTVIPPTSPSLTAPAASGSFTSTRTVS